MKIQTTLLLLCALFLCSEAWWMRSRRRRKVTGGSSGGAKSGGCDLTNYKGSEFRTSARIHTGFLSAMNTINGYAKTCKIEIYVTSSFRKSGQPVGGAIVTPARRGNHFVGHAIDFNAIRSNGRWCNSVCLRSPSTAGSDVACFIGKIRADSGLRWGGDFSKTDPVHIDDGLNLKDRAKYDSLYNALQKASCN